MLLLGVSSSDDTWQGLWENICYESFEEGYNSEKHQRHSTHKGRTKYLRMCQGELTSNVSICMTYIK